MAGLPLLSPNVAAPATRNDPPDVSDWGMVVRPITSGPSGLSAWQTSQQLVGLAAVQISAVPFLGRRTISMRASTTVPGAEIFVGASNAVTIGTGTGLKDRETISIDLDAGVEVWAIATLAGQTLYVAEVAA